MATRSDYNHMVTQFAGRDVILIEDLNNGGMSVTNDIENVVADISLKEKIEPSRYLIVYKDSEGMWDGWDHKGQDFIPIQVTDKWQAVSRLIKIQIGQSTII